MKYLTQTLILAALMIAASLSFPQKGLSQSFGITGGIGASSHVNNFRFLSDDISLDFSPGAAFSYHIGGIYRTSLGENVRLQLEPGFFKMGAKYEQPFQLRGFQFQTESRTDLNYVQLPVLFQLTTTPPDRVIFGRPRSETTYHVSGGFFGSYLLNATFSGTNSGAPIGIEFQGQFTNDVRDQYNDFDGGLIIGAGLEHGTPNQKVGFEFRFIYSALSSGNLPDANFNPHNLAGTAMVYILF